ncbi:MAG: hypothetical protein JWR15_2306 [Prosthecobacter sp.]|nr:hypothetical protein [Prosthecobacter sp.]
MDKGKAINPHPSPVNNLALWLMFLGSPVVWLLSLQVSYTMLPYACAWHSRWPLLLTSAVSALLALGNAAWGWRCRGALDAHSPTDPSVKRARFMARLGAWQSLLFALLIALQGVAVCFLDPCRQ